MSFASIFFLFFFMPFAILGYYITPKNYKNYFLIFASLLFYGIISYKILLLLICQIAVSYFGAKFLFKTNDTAKWEMELSDIAPGKSSKKEFLKDIENEIKEAVLTYRK